MYSQERTLILDNFRTLKGHGFRNFSRLKIQQDKGHREQFRRLLESVQEGEEPLISLSEILNTTKATLAAVESLKRKEWVNVG